MKGPLSILLRSLHAQSYFSKGWKTRYSDYFPIILIELRLIGTGTQIFLIQRTLDLIYLC